MFTPQLRPANRPPKLFSTKPVSRSMYHSMDGEESKYTEKSQQLNRVRQQKQLVDINSHKFKVFLALKPILFQQYKARMVNNSINKIGTRKACKAHIISSKIH